MTSRPSNRLDRREAVATLLANRPDDLLVVTGLGSSTWDLAALGDKPLNLYTWGAMGGSAMIGLGLAQARPQNPVLVLTGDGEALMGLGALATLAAKAPANLTVAVLDNEHYGETGGQQSHTGLGVDLVQVARGCGFKAAMSCETLGDVGDLAASLTAEAGLKLAVIRIRQGEAEKVLPPRDGAYIMRRFRERLLGEP